MLWHPALRRSNSNANLVCAIEHLYDTATSAVQMDGGKEKQPKTTARVHLEVLGSNINLICSLVIINFLRDSEIRILPAVIGKNVDFKLRR